MKLINNNINNNNNEGLGFGWLTMGFLNSLGLMHLMKKGWQLAKVFIRASRDFLNCADSVGARLRVSEPMPEHSARKGDMIQSETTH